MAPETRSAVGPREAPSLPGLEPVTFVFLQPPQSPTARAACKFCLAHRQPSPKGQTHSGAGPGVSRLPAPGCSPYGLRPVRRHRSCLRKGVTPGISFPPGKPCGRTPAVAAAHRTRSRQAARTFREVGMRIRSLALGLLLAVMPWVTGCCWCRPWGCHRRCGYERLPVQPAPPVPGLSPSAPAGVPR
jgi:hypothetical protein